MIDGLIAGRLHGVPKSHTSKSSGKEFATCVVRAALRDGNSIFVSVIAFSTSTISAILALSDGDSIALSGELTPKIYQPRDGGEPRASLDMLAHCALTEYHVQRKRAATKPTPQNESAGSGGGPDPDLNDPVPF